MREEMQKIPGVDKLLNHSEIIDLLDSYGNELVTFTIRKVLSEIRT